MLKAFLKFIEHHKLIAKNDKVLLAVSGGIDSIALTDLFKKSDFRYAIAHCNFQLRGNESDEDQEFVVKLASKLGVDCYVKKFDTLAESLKRGISTQMAARDLRYDWFKELMTEKGYDKLATAHHKNDNLETVIFNLTKGTGIAGFHGIKVENENIIRPLLFATRKEIEDYIHLHNLKWREDSSNLSSKYSRNLIRHKVIPLLKEINPNLENSVEQTIRRLGSVEEFFVKHVDQIRKQIFEVVDGNTWISVQKLKNTGGFEAVLTELLKDYGFNFSQVSDILSAMEDQSGKIFFSEKYVLNIDRAHLIVSKRTQNEDEKLTISENNRGVNTLHFSLHLEKLSVENCKLIKDNDIAFLDYDRIKFPLQFRKWEAGDKFSPLGMKGQKKLSDFMVDEKIPVNLKNKVYVLTSEGKIIWVVGYRIDNRHKITEKTKNILKITKVPHNVEAV